MEQLPHLCYGAFVPYLLGAVFPFIKDFTFLVGDFCNGSCWLIVSVMEGSISICEFKGTHAIFESAYGRTRMVVFFADFSKAKSIQVLETRFHPRLFKESYGGCVIGLSKGSS